MNRSRRLIAALAALGVLAVAAPAGASAASTITISGATGSAPLVALLAKKYVKLKPGKVKFKLAQGGGEVGIQDAAAGRVTIGNAARDPRASDPAGLVFYPIAKDFFCFDTNPDNKLAEPDAGPGAGDLDRPGARLERRARARRSPARST